MQLLDKLTAAPAQRYTLISDLGDEISFSLRFMPTQQAWVIALTWKDFVLNGARLVNSPNLLRGYNNIIPFGLLVSSTDGQDPFYIDDFASERIKVYLLTAAEVQLIEDSFFI